MSRSDPRLPNRTEAGFATTRWSVVLAAGERATPEAEAALETLCSSYWYPLYAYARRQGKGSEEAQDLVQGFFARLLEKEGIRRADPERGRFRSFLYTSFRNFITNEAEREGALKRGGGKKPLSIEFQDSETRFRLEPEHSQTPEQVFLRDWAVTLLGQVLRRLRDNYEEKGKLELFEGLKGYLTGSEAGVPYAKVAEELDMSDNAIKVAVHRLRGRYRDALREEILQTLSSEGDVDAEIRDLFAVLGSL